MRRRLAVFPRLSAPTRRPRMPQRHRKEHPIANFSLAARRQKKAFQPMLEAALASLRVSHPELCAGLTGSGHANFRPTATKGQSAVLVRLLQVILRPESAKRTQQDCRAIVEAEFPQFAVYKNWTKPLAGWAIAKAKTMIACSAPPISTVRIRSGSTLKDLHGAVKAAVEGLNVEAKVVVTITDDAVLVNAHRFKRTVNRAGGKEYPIVRLPIPALEAALKTKPRAW